MLHHRSAPSGSGSQKSGSPRTEEGGVSPSIEEIDSALLRPVLTSPILIRPYRAADLESLILQPAQSHLQHLLLGHGYAQTLEACEAWTFVLRAQDGAGKDQTEKVLACMGVHAIHPGRALAWSLIAGDIGRHFQAIHRAARRYLRVTPYARLEAHVDAGFTAGARWLRLLGFTCETPQGMRGFTAEGRTCHLYACVRAQPAAQTAEQAGVKTGAPLSAPAGAGGGGG
ncbi:MAG TPA: hypothetical protein VH105_21850, partial [Burkholderiales bacterium]|nr:hypothetical protein [Burkholderiales bacterium]